MFENADVYRTNWRERYFDVLHLENWRTFQPQIIDDFPAVWNYGKLSAKFLVSSVRVFDTVGFFSFY